MIVTVFRIRATPSGLTPGVLADATAVSADARPNGPKEKIHQGNDPHKSKGSSS